MYLKLKINNMFGKGKNQRNRSQRQVFGTSKLGVCICPKCNYSISHKRGVPCFTLICPSCNIPLVRQNPSENSNKQKFQSFPKIDTELCLGCGACVNECLSNAIIMIDNKAKIINEKCINCRACINACPAEAII